MIRHICLLIAGTITILFTFFSGHSAAYEYDRDTIFYDDFTAGSLENWEPILGEWLVDDAKMCQFACSS